MQKIENKSQFIGFSYFKNILKINEINFSYETFLWSKKNTEFEKYFFYKNKEILDNSLENLIFLLKNFEKDFLCLNQFILEKILKTIDLEEFKNKFLEKPNSIILRKIWFLIENILKKEINIEENLVKKIYENILDKNIFITCENNFIKNKKFKIIDNSLWNFWIFNPIIIKENLNPLIFKTDYNKNLENINSLFDKKIIEKAISYLYTKETKWSLEIEGEKFHQNRNRWFLKLISNIPLQEKLEKKDIIDFYNTIYNDKKENFRQEQNYIASWNWMMWENFIEYIPPKWENIEEFIENLINFYNKNKENLNPIILSSILSTFFVLIHPFMDWNWRTSRFLFQYSLINSWIWLINNNEKIILPVSAYIQLNKQEYYKNLENISKDLINYIEFDEKNNWEIEVLNETKNIYKNLDYTKITNYFFEVLNNSININYKQELEYISKFQKIYNFIDSNYNIISNNISFITKNLISNNWVLSNSKKKILIKKWVDLEVLEEIEKEKF